MPAEFSRLKLVAAPEADRWGSHDGLCGYLAHGYPIRAETASISHTPTQDIEAVREVALRARGKNRRFSSVPVIGLFRDNRPVVRKVALR